VLQVTSPRAIEPYERRLQWLIDALLFALGTAEQMSSDDESDGSRLLPVAQAVAYAQTEDDYPEDAFKQLVWSALTVDMHEELGELTDLALVWAVGPGFSRAEGAAARLERSFRNPVLARRYTWNLVAYIVALILQRLDALATDRDVRQHTRYEMAWPTTMLGVATLNHLWSYRPGMRLGGRLAALSSSQWILADVLVAEQEGDSIEKPYRELVAKRVAHYRQRPARHLVPPLRQAVANK